MAASIKLVVRRELIDGLGVLDIINKMVIILLRVPVHRVLIFIERIHALVAVVMSVLILVKDNISVDIMIDTEEFAKIMIAIHVESGAPGESMRSVEIVAGLIIIVAQEAGVKGNI